MDDDKTITVHFTQGTYTLTINTVGNGSVTKDPDLVLYPMGTVVELTAVPDSGWTFAEWSGDIITMNNPTTFTMESNKSVTATFTQGEPGIDVEKYVWDSGPGIYLICLEDSYGDG